MKRTLVACSNIETAFRLIAEEAFKRHEEKVEIENQSAEMTRPYPEDQEAFEERLKKRDKVCPILNTPIGDCKGAHIISYEAWHDDPVVLFNRGYV